MDLIVKLIHALTSFMADVSKQYSITLTAFASLIVSIAGYNISKKQFNKSFPYFHLDQKKSTINSFPHQTFTSTITLVNDATTPILWASTIYKKKSIGKVYLVKPIVNLHGNDSVIITIRDYIDLSERNSLTNIDNHYLANDPKNNINDDIYYFYIMDLYGNYFYYRPNNFSENYHPNRLKKISKWNLYHLVKKKYLIHLAQKNNNIPSKMFNKDSDKNKNQKLNQIRIIKKDTD